MDVTVLWLPVSAAMVYLGSITRIYDDRIDRAKRRRIVLGCCALCLGMYGVLTIGEPTMPHVLVLLLLIVLLGVEYQMISLKIIK
jgi:hypothetical protein